MVDFTKLKTTNKRPKPIDPAEVFRRLPKPPGINDLYTSQAEVLREWFDRRRNDTDTVVKLHTGGGKTLVGLLMAQSTLNETGEPVLYLAPTTQLVAQTVEKADEYGIAAVAYKAGAGVPLDEAFTNGNAIMVATYAALFHGRSKFGVRGAAKPPVSVGAIVLDDAHAAFSVVRDAFTLTVSKKQQTDLFENLAGLFRKAFQEIDKVGSFDDVVAGSEFGVLEVPYWAWREKAAAVRELLRADTKAYELVWPFLRDNLHLCHGLISRNAFTVTPVLPLVNLLPTFSEAPRRIYMSATVADDSEIIRTFDADPRSIGAPLTSRSLAGVSERMILIPELMPFHFEGRSWVKDLLKDEAKNNRGAVVLVPSGEAAKEWIDVAELPTDTKDVERVVAALQEGTSFGPVVFASRYDGIDLPGDSCRLLVMEDLPMGTSDYEIFRAGALYGGTTITRMLAQRIEQGIGRGARGSGDHCVVLLIGGSLATWIARKANFRFLTSATRAQLEMGEDVSKAIVDAKDLYNTILKSHKRDKRWTQYHAETIAELIDEVEPESGRFELAAAERKALGLWQDGSHDKAVTRIEVAVEKHNPDPQAAGWLLQLAGRIADQWDHVEKSEALQRTAFSKNRNLVRPKVLPPYRPLPVPGEQARSIVEGILEFRPRRGFLREFDDAVSRLTEGASANQFEEALARLGSMIGLQTERHDVNGKGPDVLWLLPSKVGFVIEAKSRKKPTAALKKVDHGQLLVAKEWFAAHYKGYAAVGVSVHPTNKATKAASAGASQALTYEMLAALVTDARSLLSRLCDSQLDGDDLVAECASLLKASPIRHDRLAKTYLHPFSEVE